MSPAPAISRLRGKLNDLGGVAGEIPDGGIDLAESDLHRNSVEGCEVCGRGQRVSGGVRRDRLPGAKALLALLILRRS